MEYARTLRQQQWHLFLECIFSTVLILLFGSFACAAQATSAAQMPDVDINQSLNKYPGLLPELVRLLDKFQHNIQFPPPRAQSRLLPLLPEKTEFYAAFPNYGEVSHQALKIFQQELQESPVLRDWWQQSDLGAIGPKAEDWLDKFYDFSQYLGDEIMVSGSTGGGDPNLLIVAEVRKPGLKNFLQQMLAEIPGKSKPRVRILDLPELANASDLPTHGPVVLVRQDFMILALDLAALRSFNAKLDQDKREFASTPFGQRLAQAYDGGATIVGGADLYSVMSQIPLSSKQGQTTFQRTGFGDVKYAVWEHKIVAGREMSQAELSFAGPRHGIAAWLASPASLGSVDFLSPRAMLAATVLLSNPAQIFDDLKDLATSSNPNAFAMVTQTEQALNLSLKDDVLSRLGGEITIEMDNAGPPAPAWKVLLQVNDSSRLQQTLTTLLASANLREEQFELGGVTYYSVRIPAPKGVVRISYAFLDGYLIVGPSHEAVAEAIQLHRTGESLGKSARFLASLPPGHPSGFSAMLYEDPIAMMSLRLGQVSSDAAASISQFAGAGTPLVVCAYGDESAIREATTSTVFDPTAVLVMAAVAIPNVLRAKISANEASAIGALRIVNTAELTYSLTYPPKGYAPDLATLGPDPGGTGVVSSHHAGLIDAALGNASCTSGAWCTEHGFQFRITSVCKQQLCKEFVAVGTPVTSNTGTKSFCSTSDRVIHFKVGPPITSPVSVSECLSWPPLK